MDEYQQNLSEETVYLTATLDFLRHELAMASAALLGKRQDLVSSREDMWENTAHSGPDFDHLNEMNQYLTGVNDEALDYSQISKRVQRYQGLLDSPYFGRFDFIETDCEREKIYIGLANVMNRATQQVYVYDWRAPVSSMFYRFEPGQAEYASPAGTITGEVQLKRQYKIRNGELKYFFNSDVRITDDILQEILGRNASPRMRNIVESIQKEQDRIVRDTENEVLIVQGVAGSGKTAIALHRVAFLLYEDFGSRLGPPLHSNNVLILSPHAVFSDYISRVLPELGEENVLQATFDDLASRLFDRRFRLETRAMQLEKLLSTQDSSEVQLKRESAEFKGSAVFLQLLDRWVSYFAHRLLPFEDVYYDGKIVETKQMLKNRFLHNPIGIPMAKQLQRVERTILDKVHLLRQERLTKIRKIVGSHDEHLFEIEPLSRLLSIKRTKVLMKSLNRFIQVDYAALYALLFHSKELFQKLAQGLALPNNIEEILSLTEKDLTSGELACEDCVPLMYLNFRINGNRTYAGIQHLVIDEAQDYSLLHFEVFKHLFPNAKYTILGDTHQTIARTVSPTFYRDITAVLNRAKSTALTLTKGYRSSLEIHEFTQRILGLNGNSVSLERHGAKPRLVVRENEAAVDHAVVEDIKSCLSQGYESVAVICKTLRQARRAYARLVQQVPLRLAEPENHKVSGGVLVIPSYLAKGLEFDAVLVYGASKVNYSDEVDRQLLYVACTRALHYLALYYHGEKSPLLP